MDLEVRKKPTAAELDAIVDFTKTNMAQERLDGFRDWLDQNGLALQITAIDDAMNGSVMTMKITGTDSVSVVVK